MVASRLRFPPASNRPGAPARFEPEPGGVAGQVPRPAIGAPAEAISGLRHGLVRVLDDEGNAVGPWASGSAGRPELEAGLRDMAIVRAFDAAMLRAHRQGKTSFYMQCLGEEAVACAHRRALEPGDMCFPTYRQQGLLVASGYPLVDMMNQVFSNSRDPVLGRQLPVFYSSRDRGFFSISGNLGTQFVQAVGWAMAAAIRGDDRIASGWIGEGATAEPDFHSALLFASVYQPPVILNIVNNQWAISTHQDVSRGAAPTFADRGIGFGIPAIRVDGNDYLAVHAVTEWAAARARGGYGPCLIEWATYRAGAHSTSDDPSAYRAKEATAAWPLGDPIDRLTAHLRVAHGWSEDDRRKLDEDVRRIVSDALAEAESYGTVKDGPWSDPASMFEDVFAEMTPQLLEQRSKAGF
jgi:2-oxoisovalerate dehydrogenase E1 component alpha subunit